MSKDESESPGDKGAADRVDDRLNREFEDDRSERVSRLYRFGRKILERGDDVKEIASAVLETSDRAKTEMVRMVAREVRNYLDELRLKEDVMELVRSHSLELHISMNLKPLAPEASEPVEEEVIEE